MQTTVVETRRERVPLNGVDTPTLFATINAVYARYFPADPPARSFLVVSAWHGPFDVEMDCVAMV